MKHRINLPSLCVTLLAGMLLVGCQKEPLDNGQGSGDNVEVAFAAGSLQIDPVESQPLVQVHTRATEDALAVNTAFRTVVYAKDAAVTATPLVQNTYKITDVAGTVVTTAVKADGTPDDTGTAPDPIYIKRDAYDFYYFSPALPVTSGKITELKSGVDYMAVKQTSVDVVSGTDSKFHIEKVQFARLCSRLDIKVTPKSAGSFIGSITLGTGGATIDGIASVAEYTLGEAALASVTGTEAKAFTADDFVSSGTGTTAVLSTETKAGAIVLPVTGRNLMVTLDLTIDNTPVPVSVNLPGTTLAAGYKYLLDLKVDRQGSPTFTVSVAPWTEGGSNDTPTSPVDIGSYRDGGVVFWVDPVDAKHYKVVSVDETSAAWSDAVTWAVTYGDAWRLPVESELVSLYNARRDNGGGTELSQSVIDKAITVLNATAFGADTYWSATETSTTNAQSVKLSDGTPASTTKTTALAVRTIKELPVIDYISKPANCYITQPGQAFKFDVTKKPRTFNGSTGSNPSTVPADAHLGNDLSASDIKDIKTVWQTAANHGTIGGSTNMIVQSISYNPATGICIVTPHVTGCGNALIAAYNYNNEILWNWHIWVTEGKVQANVNTGNMSLNGRGKFMDRNLGALAATTTQPTIADAYKYFGMLYQHGRPTPFTGQGAGTSVNTYTKIYKGDGTEITGDNGGFTPNATVATNVTAAIQTPTTHYSQQVGVQIWQCTWYNFDDKSLWSDYGINKSIYDPCPYGYRVPINGSWAGFPSTEWTINIAEGAIWSYTWWPAAGRRSNIGELLFVGNYSYYWSSTRHSNAYCSYYLDFDSGGAVNPSNYYGRGFAFSVRCVEDR